MAEDNNLDGSAGVIAALLDPVADTIEKGLSKIGLGKIAKGWIKTESNILLLITKWYEKYRCRLCS